MIVDTLKYHLSQEEEIVELDPVTYAAEQNIAVDIELDFEEIARMLKTQEEHLRIRAYAKIEQFISLLTSDGHSVISALQNINHVLDHTILERSKKIIRLKENATKLLGHTSHYPEDVRQSMSAAHSDHNYDKVLELALKYDQNHRRRPHEGECGPDPIPLRQEKLTHINFDDFINFDHNGTQPVRDIEKII